MDSRSKLNDPELAALLFAVLVKRLGGNTEIRQKDIDAVAYNRLEEDVETDGSIRFRMVERYKKFHIGYVRNNEFYRATIEEKILNDAIAKFKQSYSYDEIVSLTVD